MQREPKREASDARTRNQDHDLANIEIPSSVIVFALLNPHAQCPQET
jgi:hypothetical protein